MSEPTDLANLPTYGSQDWHSSVDRMTRRLAPRRFGVIGHDADIEESAILAWGFALADGDVLVSATGGSNRLWRLPSPEGIIKYYPHAPADGVEIVWVDDRPDE